MTLRRRGYLAEPRVKYRFKKGDRVEYVGRGVLQGRKGTVIGYERGTDYPGGGKPPDPYVQVLFDSLASGKSGAGSVRWDAQQSLFKKIEAHGNN